MRVRTFGLGRMFQTILEKKNHAKLRKGNNYGFFFWGGGNEKKMSSQENFLFLRKERWVGCAIPENRIFEKFPLKRGQTRGRGGEK